MMYKANYMIMKLRRLRFHFKESPLACIHSKNCNETIREITAFAKKHILTLG
jgi:hypothetical protein